MYTLILAAGSGTRLGARAQGALKCLVLLEGRSLLDRSLEVLATRGDLDVHLVGGKLADQLEPFGYPVIRNAEAARTNIVGTLARGLAAADWPSQALVLYGDIVYEPKVLAAALASSTADVVLPVNTDWRRLWALRMADPLKDAETLIMSDDGSAVLEIGGRPADYSQVQAQFMGIFRLGRGAIDHLRQLDPQLRDGLDVTSWVGMLIEAGLIVQPVAVFGGWLEVDCASDLDTYEALSRTGTIGEICELLPRTAR
ncbi:NTP transferase domain-containing protein [Nocardioides carbamazepini]|uniref:NTP transferase domain-containing protein n=1 Tax=Nocardioides carbamazepini TaxID=2854259 RepID=UPI002149B287|nr:NTP transferase domain-containing protein [Nocardioides carbamazepini]MCR1785005.1 NTP transferase domain-containing protein [Nocardioides carbamazepini]